MTTITPDKKTLLELFEGSSSRYLADWKEFLRFKSISTQPEFDGECRRSADWLKSHLARIGFKVSLLDTPSKPCVYAVYEGPPGSPTVLYYGHYDVQPVDPREGWTSDPFEPELRDGRLYARGAQDNKGQTMYFIKALEALIAAKALPVTVKLLIEGEEESGSEGISASLESWRDLLQSDVLMVCDSGMLAKNTPTLTMGLRGLVHLTVKLGGLRGDLHSGIHGGLVKNPAIELARLVATLHDSNGKIAVPGFYDSISKLDESDQKLLDSMPFDRAKYKAEIGAEPSGGEQGLSEHLRRGLRPTIELNGIHSGYGGPGSKTIIPAFAVAKITSRLVSGQDPARCLQLILNHIKKNSPADLSLEISESGAVGSALTVSSRAELVQKAARVLQNIFEKEVCYDWNGGSIPIIPALVKISGAKPLLVGFGLEEDRIHAPDESFSLEQFRSGFLYVAMMLSSL